MVPVSEERGGERTGSILAGQGQQGKGKDALAFFDLTLSNDLENKVVRSWPFMRPSQKNTENAIL